MDVSWWRTPVGRYRVMAIVTGTALLCLVAAMVLKYGFDMDGPVKVVAPIHGWLFVVYVIASLNLGFVQRWSVWRIVLVALAGTVPFASFYTEHRVTLEARRAAAAEAAPTPD